MVFGLTKNLQRWNNELVTATDADTTIFELQKDLIT